MRAYVYAYACMYVCVCVSACVDFGAGWLWFIRSPLKNRCGKGNEMHKKHGVCVLSVSDHGFFFLLFIIPDCVRGWKKNAPSNRLCYYYYSLCTQGWLPGSSPSSICMQRVYAHSYILLYYYTTYIIYTSRLLLQRGFYCYMLTFSTTGGTTFISTAIKAASWMSHPEHGFLKYL